MIKTMQFYALVNLFSNDETELMMTYLTITIK